ncbi:Hypothetical_protein [Hexamita inflata]|uniref:Hypothetical_protein n=1 Tax=Hexamita inflata TaxID=28002 RepID=A0AA86R6E3_9EUKA|nr:Hypothetical protein HINF_LOCUS57283 [Hexamita inflata]
MQLVLLSLGQWNEQTSLAVWEGHFIDCLNYQFIALLLLGLLLNALGSYSLFVAADDCGDQTGKNWNQEKQKAPVTAVTGILDAIVFVTIVGRRVVCIAITIITVIVAGTL